VEKKRTDNVYKKNVSGERRKVEVISNNSIRGIINVSDVICMRKKKEATTNYYVNMISQPHQGGKTMGKAAFNTIYSSNKMLIHFV